MRWRSVFDIRVVLGVIALGAIFVLCFDLYVSGSPELTGDTYAQIDQYGRDQMDDSRIPGVAIGIVEEGGIRQARGLGEDITDQFMTQQT